MKHPDTADLAKRAFDRACQTDPTIKTREDFARRLNVGDRTLYRWLKGDNPAMDVAAMVLREVADGWLPKVSKVPA